MYNKNGNYSFKTITKTLFLFLFMYIVLKNRIEPDRFRQKQNAFKWRTLSGIFICIFFLFFYKKKVFLINCMIREFKTSFNRIF